MTIPREIQNTPTDRGAMAILLAAGGKAEWIDPQTAFSPELNRAWMTLARQWSALEDEVFNAVQDKAIALAGGDWDSTAEARRAGELMSLLQEERHMRWVQDELAAGRDPYRAA
jgi:hypothetical protein